MSNDPATIIAELERDGEAVVREKRGHNRYGQPKLGVVDHWLETKDRQRAEASEAAERAARAEEIALTRTATEAAVDAAASAREANSVARDANALASDANALSSRALRRSSRANGIAYAAMIASVISAAVAILALVLKGG